MKVLVLVVNGLHCGPLGAYGNDIVGTPAFDRLAAEGVVFDQHYADAPDGEGARRSWRTGRYHLPVPQAKETRATTTDLWDALRKSGVFTNLVCEVPPPDFFTEGWDDALLVAPAANEPPLETVLESLADAFDAVEDRDSWLIWTELNTLIPPWRFPEEFFGAVEEEAEGEEETVEEDEEAVSDVVAMVPLPPLTGPAVGPLGDDPDEVTFLRLQETYAAAVRYVDAGLDQILESLDEDVVLVVTSDRGMVLGEHGVIGVPRPWLHEELVHLPLLVRMPGGRRGRRIASLTQSLDLVPTLLDLFGITIPDDVHGRSLLPLLRGEDAPVRDYACSGLQIGLAIEWSLRTPEWTFLLPLQGEIEDAVRPPQLYAKPEDRWEVNDVRQHHLELSEHFAQVLEAFAAAVQRPGPLAAPELRDVEVELTSPSETEA
jgi:arylsulfatase A-like enzyme